MDKKLGLGVALIGVLGVFAFGSYKVNSIKDNVDVKLNETLASINESLPPGYVVVLENNETMMGNHGFYSMQLPKGAFGVDSVIFNFDINYTPLDLLLNRLSVKTDLKLTGDLITQYKLDGYSFFDTEGKLADNYVDLKLSAEPLLLNTPGFASVNASGMNGKYYREKDKGILDFSYTIPTVDVELANIGKVGIKDITYVAVLDGLGKASGHGSFGIDSITSLQGGLKGLLFSYNTKLKDAKYDISAGMGVKNVDFGKSNTGSMNINYSLNGVLQEPLDYLITRYEDGYLVPGKQNKDGLAKEDVDNFLKIINGGFVVAMDNFSIESNLGNASAKMLGKLKASAPGDISFVDDFEYALVAKGSGSMLDGVAGLISNKVGQPIVKSADGTYNVKNEYKDRKYYEGGVFNEAQTTAFINKLNEWDLMVDAIQKLE